jgi:tRNA(Ile)-lysidine synthase
MTTAISEISLQLTRWIHAKRPPPHWVIALSGGMDSVVLLHAVQQISQPLPYLSLKAVHVHHHIQSEADAWAKYCLTLCHSLGIECVIEHVQAANYGDQSPEDYARHCRYEALAKHVGSEHCLLTAHHQRDQAETWLLQAMRGAGIKGLSAMPMIKSFAAGYLARPLLAVSHEAISAYAAAHQLAWVTDPSNVDFKYTRNFVRHQVLSTLRQRNPGIEKAFARSAQHCANAQTLLNELACIDRVQAELPTGELRIDYLKTLSPERQANCVRHWLSEKKVALPPTIRLMTFLDQVQTAAPDRKPQLRWGSYSITAQKRKLIFVEDLLK